MRAHARASATRSRTLRAPAGPNGLATRRSPLDHIRTLQRTAGNHSVGKLLKSPVLGHHAAGTRTLQRRPSPTALCASVAPKDMSPGQWLSCRDAGLINPTDADPLRVSRTGAIADLKEIRAWMKIKGLDRGLAIKHLRNSHEFTGTQHAREAAIPMDTLGVCIRPVQIADVDYGGATKLPSFDAVVSIWKKCCIDVSIDSPVIIPDPAFKTLEHEEGGGFATAQEVKLIKAAGASKCVSVFVAETFKHGSHVSKDISGGGAAVGNKFGGSIMVVEGVDPTIVAHELGHVMGYGPHSPANTIMEVQASVHTQKESDKVAWNICEVVRNFNGAAQRGKEDCQGDLS
jgi:hypothetical protein